MYNIEIYRGRIHNMTKYNDEGLWCPVHVTGQSDELLRPGGSEGRRAPLNPKPYTLNPKPWLRPAANTDEAREFSWKPCRSMQSF